MYHIIKSWHIGWIGFLLIYQNIKYWQFSYIRLLAKTTKRSASVPLWNFFSSLFMMFFKISIVQQSPNMSFLPHSFHSPYYTHWLVHWRMEPSFLCSQLFTFGGTFKICLLRVQQLGFHAGLAEDKETLAPSQDDIRHPCLGLRQFER